MSFRWLAVLACSLLLGPVAAEARTDILTGEPVRPPTTQPRREPEIVNAPHAPVQAPGRGGESPPMEIYVTPQIGGPGASPRYPGRSPY